MGDIIRDNQGNKITTGDRVNFYCKNDNIMKEGLITKMAEGSFGIKCSKYITLYKYKEVDKHIISKID